MSEYGDRDCEHPAQLGGYGIPDGHSIETPFVALRYGLPGPARSTPEYLQRSH
jgi:hypothetical protein